MNLFELAAKITLDSSEYERGLSKAASMAQNIGSKIGGAVSTIAKISTAAVGAAATGIGAVVKQSVAAYGEYEQLVGGVETLFGDAAGKVLADSERAFTEAGMSMNQYMETSIQSAASLINSLGGDQAKAAELMNVSIKDMADNVNKMGTSMEAVQFAYRGFSRGNFTMLDNLALGFAGTKQGMQDLLKKANEINKAHGKMSDYAIDSYADIVEAIHVVQEEMGITGTTAAEAADTIQGSAASVKAAWQNLVTGLGNKNADLKKLSKNLVDAVGTTAKNLIPVIRQSLDGIGAALQELAPVLTDALGDLITDVAPDLVKSAISLVKTIGKTLVDNADNIIDAADEIIDAFLSGFVLGDGDADNKAGELIGKIGDFIVRNIDKLSDAAGTVIDKFVGFLSTNGRDFGETAGQIITKLATAIGDHASDIITGAVTIVTELASGLLSANNVEGYITAAGNLVAGIVDAIPQSLTKLIEGGESILDGLVKGIVKGAAHAAGQIIGSLINSIKTMFGSDNIWEILLNALQYSANPMLFLSQKLTGKFKKELFDEETGNNFLQGFFDGLYPDKKTTESTGERFQGRERVPESEGPARMTDTGTGGFLGEETDIKGGIAAYFDNVLSAIEEKASSIGDWLNTKVWQPISDFFSGLWDKITAFIEPIKNGLAETWDSISSKVSEVWGKITEIVSPVVEELGNLFSALGDLASAAWELVKQAVGDAAAWIDEKIQAIVSWITDKLNPGFEKASDTANTTWTAIKDAVHNAIEAIHTKFEEFKGKIEELKGKFGEISDKVKTVFEDIKAAIQEKISAALTWGEDLMKNLAQGIANGISWVTEKVKAVASTISSWLHQTTADVGPLKYTDTWGGDLMDNIINGIESKRGELERQISSIANTMNIGDSASTFTFTPSVSAYGAAQNDKIDRLIEIVETYLPQFGHIELDGDVVANAVNRRLGDSYYGARRSNA